MTVAEMLQTAQFLVDADGNKKAVVFDYAIWAVQMVRLRSPQGYVIPACF